MLRFVGNPFHHINLDPFPYQQQHPGDTSQPTYARAHACIHTHLRRASLPRASGGRRRQRQGNNLNPKP